MLTGFIFCAWLKSKKAEEIVQVYLNEVYYRFEGSRKILSDNGTEFKNKMFQKVSKKLECDVRTYSPPYRPQSNSKIECFHKFLKACMGKHISKGMMSLPWLQQPIISSHIHPAGKGHSFSCLAGIH